MSQDRIDARYNIRSLKQELARHRNRLLEMAAQDLPEDDDETTPITDNQLVKAMASVILAEVNLGTDDEPNYTTRLAQILRLLLRRLDELEASPTWESCITLLILREQARKILLSDN